MNLEKLTKKELIEMIHKLLEEISRKDDIISILSGEEW